MGMKRDMILALYLIQGVEDCGGRNPFASVYACKINDITIKNIEIAYCSLPPSSQIPGLERPLLDVT